MDSPVALTAQPSHPQRLHVPKVMMPVKIPRPNSAPAPRTLFRFLEDAQLDRARDHQPRREVLLLRSVPPVPVSFVPAVRSSVVTLLAPGHIPSGRGPSLFDVKLADRLHLSASLTPLLRDALLRHPTTPYAPAARRVSMPGRMSFPRTSRTSRWMRASTRSFRMTSMSFASST